MDFDLSHLTFMYQRNMIKVIMGLRTSKIAFRKPIERLISPRGKLNNKRKKMDDNIGTVHKLY